MTDYRRVQVAGGTYFFTVNLADRRRSDLIEHIDLLKKVIRAEIKAFPFTLDALVVLPEHLHAVWTLPPSDSDFSNRWRRIKGAFSAALPVNEHRSPSQRAKGERGVWQRRFWEHLIRDETDLQRHLDYLHFNPVKHGHVSAWATGRIRRFIGSCAKVCTLSTGPVEKEQTSRPVKSRNDGLRPSYVPNSPRAGSAR